MKKSYYAIIPANVRYDKDLSANCKLLYGEITALCNENGYCLATNEYFANLYGVSIRSITSWISTLINKGYIFSEIVYRQGSKEIGYRALKIISTPIAEHIAEPIAENFYRGIAEPIAEHIAENFYRGIKEK